MDERSQLCLSVLKNLRTIMPKILTIDIHTHILPENIPNWKEKFGYGGLVQLQHHKPCCANMICDVAIEQILRNRIFLSSLECAPEGCVCVCRW